MTREYLSDRLMSVWTIKLRLDELYAGVLDLVAQKMHTKPTSAGSPIARKYGANQNTLLLPWTPHLSPTVTFRVRITGILRACTLVRLALWSMREKRWFGCRGERCHRED